MRNSRLDRILYIQQVLVQGGVLNKQQTADRFGVSEKTIQRDLDTLRNHFADSEPRREILYNSAKGGYLLDDTLSRFLTSSEILAVCKILLESRSMVKEEMFPILDKLILACTPLDRLNQVKDLISNERFHYVEPQHGRKFIESLWEIGTAVENHNVMEITYCRTHDGETRVRTIEPVGILFSEYYFYLAAFIEGIDKDKHFQNPQDNSPTIYRIDRIQSYKTLDRWRGNDVCIGINRHSNRESVRRGGNKRHIGMVRWWFAGRRRIGSGWRNGRSGRHCGRAGACGSRHPNEGKSRGKTGKC